MPFSASGRSHCLPPRARSCSSRAATTRPTSSRSCSRSRPLSPSLAAGSSRAQRPGEQNRAPAHGHVGFSWCLGALGAANDEYLWTAGLVTATIFTGLLAHLLLAFPTGNLPTRTDRRIIAAFYAVVVVGPPLYFLFDEGELRAPAAMALPRQPHLGRSGPVGGERARDRLRPRGARARRLRARPSGPALEEGLRRAPPLAGTRAAGRFGPDLPRAGPERSSGSSRSGQRWRSTGSCCSCAHGSAGVPCTGSCARGSGRRPGGWSPSCRRSGARSRSRPCSAESCTTRPPAGLPGRQRVRRRGRRAPLPATGRRRPSRDDNRRRGHRPRRGAPRPARARRGARRRAHGDGAWALARVARVSERRATALLEAIPDSMYRVAADGTFIEFRPSELRGCRSTPTTSSASTCATPLARGCDDVFAAMKHGRGQRHRRGRQLHPRRPGRFAAPPRGPDRQSGHDESVAIVRDITDRTLQQQALEALVEEQAALSRVAVAVATASRPEVLFDVVTEEVARLLGADGANLVRFDPRANEGVIVGQVERAGRPDSRCRDARRPARRRARARLQNRPPSARGRRRSRELTRARRPPERARRDLARRRADRGVRRALGRGGRVRHRRPDVRRRRRGPHSAVREPRRRRARERGGARAALEPRRGAGRAQPRRGRRRNRVRA